MRRMSLSIYFKQVVRYEVRMVELDGLGPPTIQPGWAVRMERG